MQTKKIKLYLTLVIFILVIIIGTLGFMILENKDLLDSFYYVIVTLSTVGYGDLSPVSTGGKILSIFLIVGGVGTFMSLFANLADLFISRHENERRKQKLSTIISLFFTEIGNILIKELVNADANKSYISSLLNSPDSFEKSNSKKIKSEIKKYKPEINTDSDLFVLIKELLIEKTGFLVSLLENSNAMEYDQLTKLLWSLMHVRDEFLNRRDAENLTADDISHLNEDLVRVYELLIILWIDNMINTKSNYPNFFGLSMYMNPFNNSNK